MIMNQPTVIGDRLARHQDLLEKARASNGGCRDWRGWKDAGAVELVEFAAKTPRMELFSIDLTGDAHFTYGIRMPVPRWPDGDRLLIGQAAVFDLHYQEEWRWTSPPGWLPLGLWEPKDIFHPNCRPSLRGAICLGTIQPGCKLTEIIMLGYYTLTLQDFVLNEADPHGVMNIQACEYYRNHPEYLPLTKAGLFDPWEGETV